MTSAARQRPGATLGALSASHALGVLLPLLTVPYLARTLGPEGWAPVLLAQALAGWGTLCLEYSFDLSGVRTLAASRLASEDRSARASAVWGVIGAKVLLAPVVLVVVTLVAMALPDVRGDVPLVLAMLAVVLMRGMSPLWYFQGEERVAGALLVDAVGRIAAAAGVFLLVRAPGDGWWVLGLQAGTGTVALAWLLRRVRAEVPVARDWVAGARQSLRRGAPLFLVRFVGAVYAHVGTLWLGVVAPAGVVAIYGGAERVVRAGVSLLEPVTRAFGARIAMLRGTDAAGADRLLGRLAVTLGLGGTMAAALVWWQAESIVRLALGPAFADAVPTLRLLALLLPLTALGTVWGPLRSMADGRDRRVLAAVSVGSVVGVASMSWLVPRAGAVGMASAVVLAEAVVVVILALAHQPRGGAERMV